MGRLARISQYGHRVWTFYLTTTELGGGRCGELLWAYTIYGQTWHTFETWLILSGSFVKMGCVRNAVSCSEYTKSFTLISMSHLRDVHGVKFMDFPM